MYTMHWSLLRFMLTAAFLACVMDVQANSYVFEDEPKRHALVIGNANYKHLAELPSAAEDAQKMATALRVAGFQVMEGTITSLADFEDDVLPSFRREIEEGDLVVVYLSGHGFSYGPYNYFAPLDTPSSLMESELSRKTISLETLEFFLGKREPALLLFLVDACRTLAGFVVTDQSVPGTVPKGPVGSPLPGSDVNFMIGFAARPGTPALAFTTADKLSPFTAALVSHLPREGQSFKYSFTDVMAEVRTKTSDVQQPGLVDYSTTDFYLRPTQEILTQEKELWVSILDRKDRDRVQWFSRRYAASRYARAAQKWLHDYPAAIDEASPVSPLAVERSWATMAAYKQIQPISPGLGFPRVANARALGVEGLSNEFLQIGANSPATGSNSQSNLEILKAHGTAVATSPYLARQNPSALSPGVRQIAPGTEIEIVGEVTTEIKERWLAIRMPGFPQTKLYFPAPAVVTSTKSVQLGFALLEATAPPKAEGLRDLIDRAAVHAAVTNLRALNRSITWVSLATGRTDDPIEAGSRSARLTHARYLLRQLQIPSNQITEVTDAGDVEGDGVRLRFFGR